MAFLSALIYRIADLFKHTVRGKLNEEPISCVYGGKIRTIHLKDLGLADSPYYNKHPKRSMTYLGMYPTIDDPIMDRVGERMDVATRDLNDRDKAECILRFVQRSIKYERDRSQYGERDFFAFPVNTLARRQGDCEDSTFLFANLAYHCGLDVVLIWMDGHMTSAVKVPSKKGDISYTIGGEKYVRCESTAILPIGRAGLNTRLLSFRRVKAPSKGFDKIIIDDSVIEDE